MKRLVATLKRPKVFVPVLVFALVVLFTPLSFYKVRESYQCSGCCSKLDVYQWKFGHPEFCVLPATPHWQNLRVSRTFQDFAPTNHEHQWVFAQGSPYRLGLKMYACAIGSGRNIGKLGSHYELDEDFRKYVALQEREQKLTRDQILTLLTLPWNPDPSQTNNAAFQEIARISENMLDKYFSQ